MKSLLYIACFISSFSYGQEWLTNVEDAKQIAQDKNQPIVLVFSGSDWCAPCMKLEREIWNTNTFRAYSKDHFVLLKADFPRRKRNALTAEQQDHNNKLAEQYNAQGYFPLVVVLNKEGYVLGQTGYKKTTPEAYIKLIESYIK